MAHHHHTLPSVDRILFTGYLSQVSPFFTDDCAAENDNVCRQPFFQQIQRKGRGTGTIFKKIHIAYGDITKVKATF